LSDCCLKPKWAIFQLYHGENKLHSIYGVHVARLLVFCVVFCRSLFVLCLLAIVLSPLLWFHLRFLITSFSSLEYGRSWVRASVGSNQRQYNSYLLLLRQPLTTNMVSFKHLWLILWYNNLFLWYNIVAYLYHRNKLLYCIIEIRYYIIEISYYIVS
jgi:hypothetical protein